MEGNYHFENVWRAVGPKLALELVEFWKNNKALPPGEDPEERAKEAVFVVRDKEGTIVGVCTARRIHVRRFQNYFWFYRTMTATSFRSRGIALTLLLKTKEFLEGLFKKGAGEDCIGMLFVLENRELSERFRQAVLPRSKAIFMGYNSRWEQIRVCYFEGAEI